MRVDGKFSAVDQTMQCASSLFYKQCLITVELPQCQIKAEESKPTLADLRIKAPMSGY